MKSNPVVGAFSGQEDEMSSSAVTEQEIEAATQLSANREFAAALGLYQGMLTRAGDNPIRLRLLYGVVTCAIWLDRGDLLSNTVEELRQLPDYDISNAFVIRTEAKAALDFGRPQQALQLINENLANDVLQRDDFRDWKYEHQVLKGRCLVHLARCNEAFDAFDAARRIIPDGDCETDMLIARSNCLLFLDRFSEAYSTASQVLSRCDDDRATRALQYMAECRLWQRKPKEALEIYASIQKRMPCPFVKEERIQMGIEAAMAQLGTNRSPSEPS